MMGMSHLPATCEVLGLYHGRPCACESEATEAKHALDQAQASLEEAKSKGTKVAEKLTAAYEEAQPGGKKNAIVLCGNKISKHINNHTPILEFL